MNTQLSTKNQLHLLWLGQACLMAVLAMSLPYWPLYLAKLGHVAKSELRYLSAAIYIAPDLVCAFTSPLWGRLGDRYGQKAMVVRACFGLFITQTLIMLTVNAYLILVYRILQGLLAGFIVAGQAWALAMTPRTNHSAIIGKLQSATAIGTLLGPLLGGIIATYFGYRSLFFISTIVCGSWMIAFLVFLQDSSVRHMDQKTKIYQTSSTIRQSIFHRAAFSLLLIIFIVQLARSMILPVFALFVIEHLHGNAMTVGFLYAASGAMIFLTAPFWGKIFDGMIQFENRLYHCLAILLLLSALLQYLHAFATTAVMVLVLRLLWGICLAAILPVILRLLVDEVSQDERGTYLGLGNSATKFGNMSGMLLGVIMESKFGFSNSFYMIALLYVIAGMMVLLRVKSAPMVATGALYDK